MSQEAEAMEIAETSRLLITRKSLDEANEERFSFRAAPGLSEELIRHISKTKNEPQWMLDKRLAALQEFNRRPIPKWGPDLSNLDLNKIVYFGQPDAKKNATSWEDVPEDIKRTFERLGIPEAERRSLAGAGAQYESEVIYHKLREDLEEKGVVFSDCDTALHAHPELMKEYFMTTCVPINDHKFAALHGAVWSGGTFIYVPKGVKVDLPLQAYFRMNAERMGQFEHTLIIVDEGAEVQYIEGCFTKGARITTNPDYKPIEEVRVGDKVLTHAGEYRQVYHTQVRPYSGNLYNIKIFGDSTSKIEVTEEHPFLFVKREKLRDRNKKWVTQWTTADKLAKLDYLAIPVNKVVKKSRYHEFEIAVYDRKAKKFTTIKKKVPLSKDFFRLIGYYLAEGSISGGAYLNFSFGSSEEDFMADVEQILKRLFRVSSHRNIHKKNNGTSIVVNSTELCRIFSQFGTKSYKKEIPHWLLLEDPNEQKELVIGLFRGDGNYYKKRVKNDWLKEAFRISSTSEKLARQIREILLRLGIFAFLNKRDREKPRRPIYTVGITGDFMKPFGALVGVNVKEKLNNKRRASMFYVDKNYAYMPIKKIINRHVQNIPVYNFGVEGDESYVAEGVVVHNCSAPQYANSSLHAGCVEIFVKKGARARYSSVENWSKNTYNLNTNLAVVEENGAIEWIGGNMGSGVTMLYPSSILKGKNARADHLSIAFAGKGQNQDTGAKVFHLAPNTTSVVKAKSISVDGGITSYRGLLNVVKGAKHSKSSVNCDAIIIGDSKSNTYPTVDIRENEVDIGHEATVGRIGNDQLFYLMSRGLSKEEAMKMIVSGFIEPITKALPLEYAVELNRLIELEMEGSVG